MIQEMWVDGKQNIGARHEREEKEGQEMLIWGNSKMNRWPNYNKQSNDFCQVIGASSSTNADYAVLTLRSLQRTPNLPCSSGSNQS